MKTTTKITVLSAALLAVGAATNIVQHFELPRAKVTVKVVDEHGAPLENANVKLVFGNMTVKGATDVNGLFTGEGRCGIDGMGSAITKDGYYFGAAPLPERDDYTYNEALNRWGPWNATYVAILRPIVNPVPLYAKNVRTNIPVFGQPCGFDLEVGDWVAPFGKGMKMDLIFNIHDMKYVNGQNFDIQGELVFSNPADGLQQTSMSPVGKNSVFEWERQAPEDGYVTNYLLYHTWWESKHQKPVQNFKFGGKEWEGYYLRVRTVVQDGQIVSARYGKIRGGIEVDPHRMSTCIISFNYYLNPTPNDRNLEWKVGNNLFKGLADEQTPREP